MKRIVPSQELAVLIRIARGDMSLRKFAKRVGLAYMTIKRLEDAEVVPDVETICRLAPVLRRKPVELFEVVAGEKASRSRAASSTTDEVEIAGRIAALPREKKEALMTLLGISRKHS
jgi:transcriptional regulator with XRE-family HTH domain